MSGTSDRRERNCCGSFCAFLLTAGFFILIYWAIFQPHQIRAAVDSAALSNLTVSPAAAAVSYHLAVNLSLYNPSKRVGIYYDAVAAELRLRDDAVVGQGPSAASPAEFYQGSKSGDVVTLEFDGRGVAVAGDVASELEKAVRGEAPVSLELHVDLRVRYRFAAIKIRQKPRVWCWISIPVKAEGRGAGAGGAVAPGDRCRVKY